MFGLFVLKSGHSQVKISYEQMANYDKSSAESGDIEIYLAKDGHEYKIGDTIKIGRPSSNKVFGFITTGSTAAAVLGQAPQPVEISSSGTMTVIKKIGINGNKRMGYRVYFSGKGICAICPNYFISVDDALATGEIVSKGMTREQAIVKLKEAKDLLDLGMISKEEFEKLKIQLSKYINQN